MEQPSRDKLLQRWISKYEEIPLDFYCRCGNLWIWCDQPLLHLHLPRSWQCTFLAIHQQSKGHLKNPSGPTFLLEAVHSICCATSVSALARSLSTRNGLHVIKTLKSLRPRVNESIADLLEVNRAAVMHWAESYLQPWTFEPVLLRKEILAGLLR